MLLLLLSYIYIVYYDLLNCEEIVKEFNESSIVNYHRQIRAQMNSLLQQSDGKTRNLSVSNADGYGNNVKRLEFRKDQNKQNLKKTTEPPTIFLPSPQLDPVPPHQGLPPFLPGSSAPSSAIPPDPNVTREAQYPAHKLIPMNSIYSELKNASSHYLANHSNLRSIFGPRGPSLYKVPPFLGHFHIIPFSYPTFRPMYAPIIPVQALPPGPPSFYVSEYVPLYDSTLITTTIRTTNMGASAKVWFEEIAPYTRPKKKKTKASEDLSRFDNTETTMRIPRRTTSTYWSLTGTATTAQVVNTDDDEYNSKDDKDDFEPETMEEDPNKNEMMTIAGDVLYGKIKVQKPSTTQAPKQHHLELMEQMEEGYLMVFSLEMFRLIAVKDKREVQEVLSPMGTIYNNLTEIGNLTWLGDPLLIIVEKLSIMASGGVTIDVMRTYSSMMFHTLLQRKEVLSPELNSIIDQAEMFYSEEEGNRLLRSLSQFEDYPNTSKANNLICESLVDNIIQPFRRPAVGRSRKRFLDSVNRALRRRFPLLTRERLRPKVGTNPSERNFIYTVRPKLETNPSKRKFIVTVRPRTNPSERRRKHHHKKKRKRKTFLKPEFYNKKIYMRH